MEFGGEMWRNDSCRATKKKREGKRERKKGNTHKKKEKKNICLRFPRVFRGFSEGMLAVSRRASKHCAGYRVRTRGIRDAAVAPRFHASPATGHRDEKNLITIPPDEGGGWRENGRKGWKEKEGKEIGGRSRSFVRPHLPTSPPPAVAVSGGGRIIEARLPPLNLLKSD